MLTHAELAVSLEDAEDRLGRARAVLLPDLFVDHVVPVPTLKDFEDGMTRLLGQGGGNMLFSPQRMRLGGNAANTAYALARLGVPTTLVTRTDSVGRFLWEQAVEGLPADARGVKEGGRSATTVALELREENANVMISDPGPLAELGPEDLDDEVWGWIEEADVVAVTNWAQTLRHGTRFVEQVVKRAAHGGAFTFLDTGDPAHRPQDVLELLGSGLFEDLGAWGMNEHEVRFFAGRLLDKDPASLQVLEAYEALRDKTGTVVDLHTHDLAMSMDGDERVEVPSFPVRPVHRTGAGDAWNAGDLTGWLLGWGARERLTLAHALATLTIKSDPPGPPAREEVVAFLADA